MRFVDLFCGIGGFHAALHRLGHECVFATDIDAHAAAVYEKNWGQPGGFAVHCDIRKVLDEIPQMDIICAGFPCQPFSKSGAQEGFEDQTRGTLFHDICTLTEKHMPAVLFLENVPNLVAHDNGNTMQVIESRIEEMGYTHWWEIISPHNYGICQIRKRVYIVCIRNDLVGDFDFEFPEEQACDLDIRTVLDDNVDAKYNMTEDEIHWLNMWEDFLKNVNTETKLPGHPIWSDCFQGDEEIPGDLAQYEERKLMEIADLWSDYGWVKPVDADMTKEQMIKSISLPLWKQDFIRKNRSLYSQNKEFIDTWLKKWNVLDIDENGNRYIPVSRTKYEWQAGPTSRTNWENIFQFRPSGIRVKRSDYFPALVAMAQIPVVGWLKRHITPIECARIQNFDVDGKHGSAFVLGDSDQQSYKQLGNAVNVDLIFMIQKQIDAYLPESYGEDTEELEKMAEKISQWDWIQFFRWCARLGPQLDSLEWRIVKGIWTNIALEHISGGKAKKQDNQIGFDLIFDENRIESKGEKAGVFRYTIKSTKSLMVKNPHGPKESTETWSPTFEYLLILQTAPPYKAAITTWEFVDRFKLDTKTDMSANKDQVESKIPYKYLRFVTPGCDGKDGLDIGTDFGDEIPLLKLLEGSIGAWFSVD